MDTLSNVEKERARLEEYVAKLQSALQHWQKWNFEYEALKEEIAALPARTTSQTLSRTAYSFEGEVLDEKEIRELLGQDKGINRKPEQVVALLSRRIDYVQRNVETVQKQVDGAVIKLGKIGPTDKQDMTEILEELDEEGNVVSSRLSRPGEATSEVVNALKKAGVKEDDFQEIDPTMEDETALDMTTTSSCVSAQGKAPASAPDIDEGPASGKKVSEEQTGAEGSRRKSVTFAEDTKAESAQSAREVQKPAGTEVTPNKTTSTRQRIPVIVKNNFEPQDRVLEVGSDNDEDDVDENSTHAPIIPVDESEADAMMRREMLAYSMNEMGAIVAQLDLAETSIDDEGSYYTDDDDDDEDEDEDGVRTSATATDDEEENEFGMNATGMMSTQYRQEMQDLEARLNAKYFANLGPDAAGMLDEGGSADVEQLATHTARIAVKDDENMSQRPARGTTSASVSNPVTSALKTTAVGSAKKGVRFAEELDVAPPKPEVQVPKATIKTLTPGIRDVVQERDTLHSASATAPVPPDNTRKPSRFKASRSASVQTANPSAANSPLHLILLSRFQPFPNHPIIPLRARRILIIILHVSLLLHFPPKSTFLTNPPIPLPVVLLRDLPTHQFRVEFVRLVRGSTNSRDGRGWPLGDGCREGRVCGSRET